MKKFSLLLLIAVTFFACKQSGNNNEADNFDFKAFTEAMAEDSSNRFADVKILAYDASGINSLTTKQKELVYYLSQAALSGREIIYAQNYKHNIQIKRTLEQIYHNYEGDKSSEDWSKFESYLKRVWFSNGIHHHYAERKNMIQDFQVNILTN